MKTLAIYTPLTCVCLSAVVASSLLNASLAFGQVNGVGPSDPSLFDNVFTIPTDPGIDNSQSFGGVAGETTQLNLSDGGSIGSGVVFNEGVELNISGGILQRNAEANEGSEINISGGTIRTEFGIDGAEANISGGFFEGLLAVGGGRGNATNNVAVTGGVFNDFRYTSSTYEGPVNAAISGGNFRGDFTVFRFNDAAAPTGQIELIGGDFQVNGTSISGSTLTLAEGDVFTGTLQDGSGFLLSSLTGDDIEQLSLTRVALPSINTDPIVINTPQTSDLFVRSGQTLTVQNGGELEFSQASGATVNIDGGSFSNGEVFDSTVNVSGGTASFDSLSSEVNISGGVVQGGLDAYSSEINVSGGTASGIRAISDSVVNVSGGTANGSASQNSVLNVDGGTVNFSVGNSSVANITGGIVSVGAGFGNGARAIINVSGEAVVTSLETNNSEINISGGAFTGNYNKDFTSIARISGGTFERLSGNGIELVGGDFKLNGIDFTGSTLANLSDEDVFTGTFQDGSSFIFSGLAGSRPSGLTLSSASPLPAIDTTPIVVNTARVLPGLREGQTLTLQDGGELTNFRSVGGTLNQEGGNLGRTALVTNSVVNISGGSIGNGFAAFLGSEVNISGETVGEGIDIFDSTATIGGGTFEVIDVERSTVNLSGGTSSFSRIADQSFATISGGDFERIDILSGSEVTFSGANSTFLTARDDSRLSVSGGTAGVSASGNSNVDISGGDITFLSTFGDSTVNISGGVVGDDANVANTVNISGGVVGDGFNASRSTVTISGGSVGDFLHAELGSIVGVSGGVVGDDFDVSGSAVDISGGSVGTRFEVSDGSTVSVSGGSVGDRLAVNSGSTLNVSGGSIGNRLAVNSGSTVNVSGGRLGFNAVANDGSVFNIAGGDVESGFVANSGSEVNVTGGTIGKIFSAEDGSVVDISGGFVENGFSAQSGSNVVLRGGRIGNLVSFDAGSNAQLVGGEFKLNGQAYTDSSISLRGRDVFTGTLADGSAFIFDREEQDVVEGLSLTTTALAMINSDPIVVDSANFLGRHGGLRASERLILRDGGELGDVFEVVEGTIDVEGGSVGDDFSVVFGTANISGGSFGNAFTAGVGSEVNISGGEFGSFGANLDSSVNLTGLEFFLDDARLDLIEGELFAVTDRDVVLSGTLLDGSDFSFSLSSSQSQFFFDPTATVTVTVAAVPEPSSVMMLFACGFGGLLGRRRKS